jgi:hypothetical protein
MHQQIRTVPAKSPPDLRAFLAVLEKAGVNIEAAGGGDVERGGEFAIAVAHGAEDHAMAVLRRAGYQPRLVDVDNYALANSPGQLLASVAEVAAKNAQSGLVIRDVSIGVPDDEGRIQVQIYSEGS